VAVVYKLKKFEAKITLNPVADASVTVSSGGSVTKEWQQNLFTKTTTVSFAIAPSPSSSCSRPSWTQAPRPTSRGHQRHGGGEAQRQRDLHTKWEGSWGATQSFSITPTFTGFTANAQVTTSAKAEAPFQTTAYLYYVAGPFLQLVPYVRANAGAQAGTSTGSTTASSADSR